MERGSAVAQPEEDMSMRRGTGTGRDTIHRDDPRDIRMSQAVHSVEGSGMLSNSHVCDQLGCVQRVSLEFSACREPSCMIASIVAQLAARLGDGATVDNSTNDPQLSHLDIDGA